MVFAVSSSTPGDPYLTFMRGAFVGEALILLIAPTFQDLRYEYPLLPISAVGIAQAVGLVRGWISGAGGRADDARPVPRRPARARPDSAAVP